MESSITTKEDYALFWNECVSAQGLSTEEKTLWFSKVTYKEAHNNTLKVEAPSKFFCSQMTKRYKSGLEKSLLSLTATPFKVEFIVSTSALKDFEEIPSPHPASIPSKIAPEDGTRVPEGELFSGEVFTPSRPAGLQEHLTFANFIVGGQNKLAANAAEAAALSPGSSYNPLLIYGGVGLGKTHLMQAIGNTVFNNSPQKKIVYITAESFLNNFIQSIRDGKQPLFKQRYRTADVLLIDDIHDLQSKKETQEELFHTFNALYEQKKQLVFTCDRPAKELKNFTERLRSRFERGLNVELHMPSYEIRKAIILKKLDEMNFILGEEVIDYISKNITTNVRDLEAALTRLQAYHDFVSPVIIVEDAKDQLHGLFISTKKFVSIEEVQKEVCTFYKISSSELISAKKSKKFALPRQVAMYILRAKTDFSTTEIGQLFGGRDHTTVMHSEKKIAQLCAQDKAFDLQVQSLIKKIYGD